MFFISFTSVYGPQTIDHWWWTLFFCLRPIRYEWKEIVALDLHLCTWLWYKHCHLIYWNQHQTRQQNTDRSTRFSPDLTIMQRFFLRLPKYWLPKWSRPVNELTHILIDFRPSILPMTLSIWKSANLKFQLLNFTPNCILHVHTRIETFSMQYQWLFSSIPFSSLWPTKFGSNLIPFQFIQYFVIQIINIRNAKQTLSWTCY